MLGEQSKIFKSLSFRNYLLGTSNSIVKFTRPILLTAVTLLEIVRLFQVR